MKKLFFIAFITLSCDFSSFSQIQAAGWFLDNPTPTTGSINPRPHGGADVPILNSTYVSAASPITAGTAEQVVIKNKVGMEPNVVPNY